jgi:acetyl-CoA carboxylase biotin carboxyl carrier protein
MEINIKQIKELIKLVETSDKVNELEVCEKDKSIRVKCGVEVVSSQVQVPVAQPTTAPAAIPNLAPCEDKTKSPEHAPGFKVKSPMVGTYYSAPSPDAKPFLKIGEKVNKGDTLCIVEAMKIMNQIESEVSGTVKQILIKDSEPVEFDQVIIIIEE